MKMRAARIHKWQEPLEIDEVPMPDVGPNEVFVKDAATGTCQGEHQVP